MASAAPEASPDAAAVKRAAKPRTPKVLQKPKALSVKTATEEWAATTKAIEGLKILQAEAAKVLLENAERTGKRTFGDRIAVVQTGGSLVLDQTAAKERLVELGERVEGFMKKTKLGWSLKLLK